MDARLAEHQARFQEYQDSLANEEAAHAQATVRANAAEASLAVAEKRAADADKQRQDAVDALAELKQVFEKIDGLISPDSLRSEPGRAWLREQLHGALREVQHGPGGAGWAFNETLREKIEERAEFLEALVELLQLADLAA